MGRLPPKNERGHSSSDCCMETYLV
jgi:hypothetical protein